LKHIEIPDSWSGYESVNVFSSLVTWLGTCTTIH
jgi:hypothetical protein